MNHPTPSKDSPHPLFSKIKWLMFLRVVVVTLLLGAAAFVQIKAPHLFPYASSYYLFALIVFTYFLTLLYIFLLRWIRALQTLA
jgi:hypothetical protein